MEKRFRILNLYAGIGGNRKDWTGVDVTAVEYNEEIADIYRDLHPEDEVIVTDAHQFLEKNWREYDIIWSSPPCQSHSKVRMMASKSGSYDAVMPDMKLWSEILFLKHFRNERPWVVENVKPYYEPFVQPTQKLGRHMFWCNFNLPYMEIKDGLTHNERGSSKTGFFDLTKYKTKHRKDQIIRNCVNPELGNYVLSHAINHLKLSTLPSI